MDANQLIEKLLSFKLHGSQDKAILLIDGVEFPITEVMGVNPIALCTKPIHRDSNILTPYRILEKAMEFQKRIPNENIPVIVLKYEDNEFMPTMRKLIITSVTCENRTLIINAHYMSVGDHVLLESDNECYGGIYICGTVKSIDNKFEKTEVFTLKNAYYSQSDGSIDAGMDYPAIEENTQFLFEQDYHIRRYFSNEEWNSLSKQINIHRVLKDNLPFLNDVCMKKLLGDLVNI